MNPSKTYSFEVRAVSFFRNLNADEDDDQVKALRLYFIFNQKMQQHKNV